MIEPSILIPLIIIFASGLIAALFGLPWLKHRLTLTQLSWLLALAPLTAFGFFLADAWIEGVAQGVAEDIERQHNKK